MAIRWRNKDKKELQRVVRNFNAKRNRILKKNPNAIEYLPEAISYKDLKNTITTRADFNRNMNRIKRFSRKGAEEPQLYERGLYITKYELNEARILQRVTNRKRKKLAKKVRESYEKENIHKPSLEKSLEEMNEEPVHYQFKKKTNKTFRKAFSNLLKETSSSYESDRASKYKDDYLRNIREHLGYGVIPNILYATVMQISASTMYYSYYNDTSVQIQFLSDPLATDFIAYSAYEGWCNAIGIEPEPLEDLEGRDIYF